MGLLGRAHYGPVSSDTDIFSTMALASNGSAGFTTPLGAGDYSLWIQDFNAGRFNYGFRFGVQAVPEPGSVALFIGLGVSGAGFLARRHRRASQPA